MRVQNLILSLTLVAGSMATEADLLTRARGVFKPIPLDQAELMKLIDNPKNPITPEKVDLGKKLYFDTRLSKSNLISCNTCHNLSLGGVDGVGAAIGHKWMANPHHLNSPTVYNSVFNFKQFWDGRAADLEEQAMGPIVAEPEMAATEMMVAHRIKASPEYVEEFAKVFGDEEISLTTIGKAIGAFERTLVTRAPFDEYLEGNQSALNEQETRGLKLFMDKGCITCHSGVGVGGTMFQKFPLMGKYKYENVGDFKGNENGLTKVPILRNITQTAPYLHNGAVWTLEEAVEIMAENQLGIKLSAEEVADIVAFMGSLEGEKPKIELPILPNWGPKTIRPNVN
ncbi:MAG: cytochrome-c peroxidase [Candidatus Cloacimonetes bacterium]|nr:cytochrome-c peroxidase [Candidatus Cloacimonadota bacterium]